MKYIVLAVSLLILVTTLGCGASRNTSSSLTGTWLVSVNNDSPSVVLVSPIASINGNCQIQQEENYGDYVTFTIPATNGCYSIGGTGVDIPSGVVSSDNSSVSLLIQSDSGLFIWQGSGQLVGNSITGTLFCSTESFQPICTGASESFTAIKQ